MSSWSSSAKSQHSIDMSDLPTHRQRLFQFFIYYYIIINYII